jgi:nicotinate-nucleotide adenylyltransferase
LRGGGGVGLLGGTFDPIHHAHLRLAEAARGAFDLERVCFIPASTPALKQRDVVAPAAHRLEMVRRAVSGHCAFCALDIELRRPGPSYTVDTLRELRAQGEKGPLWFLVGSDVLPTLPQWREPEQLLALANLGVASRTGTRIERLTDWLPAPLAKQYEPEPGVAACWRHNSGRLLRWFELESLEIASSQIRALLRAGRSARYLVPDSVLEYIEEHGLYKENS